MVYASELYSMGGVSYDIVAVDRTKEAIDSASRGVDSVGVHYSDTISNIAFNFNMLTMAAETAYGIMMKGWNETIGVAEQYQDQMDNMHNMFGMSIKDAQKWRAVSIATDTDVSSLSITMRYLTQRVTDQSEAGEKLRSTLKGIGVDVKDSNGNWKEGSELMMDVIKALHEVPEGAERAGVAYDVLGRNWYRVADMINNADTAAKTFEETSPGITEEDSEKIERFKIKWAQLAEKIELAKVDLGLWMIEYAEANKTMGSGDALGSDPYSAFMLETFGFNKKVIGAGGRSGDYNPNQGVHAGADFTGKTIQAAALSAATENLFLNLTDTDREIKYQSEVVIPKYEQALKDAEAAGKDVAEAQYNLANAIDHLNDLKTQDTDRTKAQVDAYKEYTSAIEKANDAKSRLYDLEANYADTMQNAGMDVAAARKATQSYLNRRMGIIEDVGQAQLVVTEAATEYNAIKAGTPLEQIKGTEQYEKAQATTIEKIVIENMYLSQDYTANDFMNDLTAGRIAKGVPISR